MEIKIYELLNYIKKFNRIPLPSDLSITDEKLKQLIKKCIKENLLDQDYIFVNILGQVQLTDDASTAITIRGFEYIDSHNPIGNII